MTATLARAGYDVVAIARNQSTALAKLEGEHTGRVRFIAWDLGETGSWASSRRRCASFMAESGVWLTMPASERQACCQRYRTAR